MSLLEIENVTLKFGGLTAVDNLSFTVEEGEVFAIVGPNGAGKSTVFNLISRFYDPYAGQIRFDGHNLLEVKPSGVAAYGVARTFQNIELFEHATVLQNLLVGRHRHRKTNLFSEILFTPSARRQELENREKVEEVIFIAPDGIKTSTWYSLATYPGVLRNVFRSFIVRPQGFQRLVNVMHKYGIVDKGILKFANTQMRTTRQRRRVYYSWTVFKPLKFPMKRIAHLLNAYQIPVQMYLGKYDKIMTEENMRHLLDRLDQQELHVLETGHNHLIEETAKALAASQPEVGR